MTTPSPAIAFSAAPKMGIELLKDIRTKEDLSLAYTPGIAEVCKLVVANEGALHTHTFARNNLAVISDGSAVLGLGNIGHKAGYPVMEGKAMLFKRFGGIDALPIVVKTQNVDEFVSTVGNIADSFAAINLEDIAAPRCFEIETKLKEKLSIPIMHDDQWGTAVVVLAALHNALSLIPHQGKDTRIVINGVGAAGTAVGRLLLASGYTNLIFVDSKETLHKGRTDLVGEKIELLKRSNRDNIVGPLSRALAGAGAFIGVSRGNLVKQDDVRMMEENPIIIAMANPIPEIMPDEAKKAGAGIVASGRSDFANQVNNALAFPGIFRAAITLRTQITRDMLLTASQAIVAYHKPHLSRENLMPSILDEGIHTAITEAILAAHSA